MAKYEKYELVKENGFYSRGYRTGWDGIAPADAQGLERIFTLYPPNKKGKFYAAVIYSLKLGLSTVSMVALAGAGVASVNMIASVRERRTNRWLANWRIMVDRHTNLEFLMEEDFHYDFVDNANCFQDSTDEWQITNPNFNRQVNTRLIENSGKFNYKNGILVDPQLTFLFAHGGSGNMDRYNSDPAPILYIEYDIVELDEPLIKKKVHN